MILLLNNSDEFLNLILSVPPSFAAFFKLFPPPKKKKKHKKNRNKNEEPRQKQMFCERTMNGYAFQ